MLYTGNQVAKRALRHFSSVNAKCLFIDKLRNQGQGEVVLRKHDQDSRVLELIVDNRRSRWVGAGTRFDQRASTET